MPATTWLSSPTQAIAAFDKPAEPCSLPVRSEPFALGFARQEIGLVLALGLAVEYHFDTGIRAHDLDDCRELGR
jgi:hypothetical protein